MVFLPPPVLFKIAGEVIILLTVSTLDCHVTTAPRNDCYHGSIKGTRHCERSDAISYFWTLMGHHNSLYGALQYVPVLPAYADNNYW